MSRTTELIIGIIVGLPLGWVLQDLFMNERSPAERWRKWRNR